MLGIDLGFGLSKGLDTELIELSVAPLLRPLVSEHGAEIPESSRPVVEHAVLDTCTHHRRRVLWPHGELLAIERIGEGVHLLLHDVGDFANTAHEEGRGLQYGGPNLAIAVVTKEIGHKGLQPLPPGHLFRQQVIHSLDPENLLGALDITHVAGHPLRIAAQRNQQ